MAISRLEIEREFNRRGYSQGAARPSARVPGPAPPQELKPLPPRLLARPPIPPPEDLAPAVARLPDLPNGVVTRPTVPRPEAPVAMVRVPADVRPPGEVRPPEIPDGVPKLWVPPGETVPPGPVRAEVVERPVLAPPGAMVAPPPPPGAPPPVTPPYVAAPESVLPELPVARPAAYLPEEVPPEEVALVPITPEEAALVLPTWMPTKRTVAIIAGGVLFLVIAQVVAKKQERERKEA